MRWPSAALLLPLLLVGCAGAEPWDRDGAWRAQGTNDANLRAMIVDPAHLSRGVQAPVAARGEAAAIAAGRLAFPSMPSEGTVAGQGVPAFAATRSSSSSVGR